MGQQAHQLKITGNSNTALGNEAGQYNIIGSDTVHVGVYIYICL